MSRGIENSKRLVAVLALALAWGAMVAPSTTVAQCREADTIPVAAGGSPLDVVAREGGDWCPAPGVPGSLDEWIQSCHDGADCPTTATVCTEEFSVAVSMTQSDVTTYIYDITRFPCSRELSHFTVDLGMLACLAEDLEALVITADITVPGSGSGPVTYSVAPQVGLDPTTGLVGMKIELTTGQQEEWPEGATATLRFVLDGGALQAGYRLSLGECRVVATKAGPQDIRSGIKSPGYACLAGPICEEASFVELSALRAVGRARQVLLKWQTASEIDNVGFHIWRSATDGGDFQRITTGPIPAKGSSTSGASYVYNDRDVLNGQTFFYKLEDIDGDGTTTFHGPVAATAGSIQPIAPENDGIAVSGEAPTFTWTSTGYERFRLQFSRRPDFKARIVSLPRVGMTQNGSTKTPWIAGMEYTPTAREWRLIQKAAGEKETIYWRVLGNNHEGTRSRSRVRSVKIR